MIMWVILLLTATALLFLLPVIGALREWQCAGDAKPLEIIQAHAGDIRHFADRFRSMVKREIEEAQRQVGSAEAAVPGVVDTDGVLLLAEGETGDFVAQRVVVAEDPLVLPNGFSSDREVYGKGPVVTGVRNRLCAILAEGDLHLRNGTVVSRWAHARSIHVGSDCVLWGRLSAVREITMESNCQFIRVYAPRVRFAPNPNMYGETELLVAPDHGHKMVMTRSVLGLIDGRRIVEDDLVFPGESLFRGDLVVRRNWVLGRGSKIEGNVKVYGSASLEPGAKVDGSLICGGPLMIAGCCCLKGPVVSESGIKIGTGTTIGEPNRPTTVSASTIRIASGVTVYGTVWARQQATIEPQEGAGGRGRYEWRTR